MHRNSIFQSAFALSFLCLTCAFGEYAAAGDSISFSRDVAPILLRNCQACHGPDKAKSKYRVDTFERLRQAGSSDEPAITAGKPEMSELYRLLVAAEDDERMPQMADALPPEQIALIKQWIEQGAKFDGKNKTTPLAELIPTIDHRSAPQRYPRPLPITALAFSKDGQHILASGYHEITIWNTANGKLSRRIGGIDQRTYALAISPDGQTIAVAGGTPGERGEVRLMNVTDGKLRAVLMVTTDVVLDLKYTPDGATLATCGADNTIRIWNAKTHALERVLKNHADWVTAIAFDKDSKRIASASRDKSAKVYDLSNGKQLASYNGHGQSVYGVAFHPDGQRMLSSGEDNRIHLWTIKDRKREESMSFGGDVFKLIRDGEQLFAGSTDKTARLFSTSSRKELRKFEGHKDWIHALAYDPKSHRLATGSQDGEIRVWNTKDGKLIRAFIASPGYGQH